MAINLDCICGKPDCDIPFGYCHCGCGQKTSPSRQSDTKRGYVRGRLTKYFKGHGKKLLPAPSESAQPFKIGGEYCRLIPLNKGLWAIVNAKDYLSLSSHKWFAWKSHSGNYYAVRRITVAPYKRITVWMHREVLGLAPGDPREGDHVEPRETLNNSQNNLRIATFNQNQHNRGMRRTNTSGFKGVIREGKMWRAGIGIAGKSIYLGARSTPEAAAVLYAEGAKKYHGKFARIA